MENRPGLAYFEKVFYNLKESKNTLFIYFISTRFSAELVHI